MHLLIGEHDEAAAAECAECSCIVRGGDGGGQSVGERGAVGFLMTWGRGGWLHSGRW
jgi:hypothetical protein